MYKEQFNKVLKVENWTKGKGKTQRNKHQSTQQELSEINPQVTRNDNQEEQQKERKKSNA